MVYPGEHKAIVDEELWSAVQARLTDNRTIRRKARVETGALLGGLIYDDRGNIMSPTYSVRRGNRYRYYSATGLNCFQQEAARGHKSLIFIVVSLD